MYDLLRGITPGEMVFKNLQTQLGTLSNDERFNSRDKANNLIDNILPLLGERRKTDIGNLVHAILGQIFTEGLAIEKGLRVFYEIMLDYNPSGDYDKYRIDGVFPLCCLPYL